MIEYTEQPIAIDNQNPGGSPTQHFNELTAGSKGMFKVNAQGLWLGTTQIIDSDGLNSLNNFRQDYIVDLAAFETTSTSYVDVTGSTMDSFTLTRQAYVLYIVNIFGRNRNVMDSNATLGYDCSVQLYDTEEAISKATFDFAGAHVSLVEWGAPDTFYSNSASGKYTKVNILRTDAGTHTLKLRLKANGGGTARITSADFGYLILGI